MTKLLVIGVGGFLGAVTRHLVSSWALRFGTFPYGTLLVNVLGCFVLGALWALAREREWLSPNAHALWTIGFLGSLTTFSTFGNETVELLLGDKLHLALANVAANLGLGLLAVALGRALMARFA